MNKNTVFAILIYFAAISLITAIVTVSDKLLAKKNGRRVPEKVLFLLAFLGGSVAEIITMKIVRHKTLHKRFMVGIPFIIVLQIAVVILIVLKVKQVI